MVYRENFIAVIKNKGKILRENRGIIKLPFGSEYEVLMKNKNSVRALINVEVDGKDALDGNGLIIGPNEEFSLKGFMKGTYVKNKFRFIKKTKHISDYRGDRVDDGIVRVEFRFEEEPEHPQIWWNWNNVDNNPVRFSDFVGGPTSTYSCSDVGSSSFISSTMKCSSPHAEEGITVKGAKVNQSFAYGSIGELETSSSVINIKLQGYRSSGKALKKPITTKTKIQCPTCGKKSKSSAHFCARCSTALD